MRSTQLTLRGLAAVLFTFWMATTASAAPITVSAGGSALFNFDFVSAGIIPAPPYTSVIVVTNLTLADAGDAGGWSVFTELNGGGSLIFSPSIFASSFSSTSIGDGVFSALLSVTAGSVTVDPIAFGRNATGQIITPGVPLGAVPEPASLLLLGSGIAGIAAKVRRRRMRNQKTFP